MKKIIAIILMMILMVPTCFAYTYDDIISSDFCIYKTTYDYAGYTNKIEMNSSRGTKLSVYMTRCTAEAYDNNALLICKESKYVIRVCAYKKSTDKVASYEIGCDLLSIDSLINIFETFRKNDKFNGYTINIAYLDNGSYVSITKKDSKTYNIKFNYIEDNGKTYYDSFDIEASYITTIIKEANSIKEN